MVKKYFKKIIAQSPQDLQVISACCQGGKIKIEEIKYLPKNKIFLFLIERNAREKENPKEKVKSIVKFEYIEKSKSKNIDRTKVDSFVELTAINLFKNNKNYEITLLFSDNGIITLTAEIIEAVLEDQSKINDFKDLESKIKQTPINLIFNCAGVFGGSFEDQQIEKLNFKKFQEVLMVNSFSILKIMQIILSNKLSTKNLEVLVNISSDAGSIELNNQGNAYIYRASKSALNSITKNMSLDLNNRFKTIVFAIDPGNVQSGMNPGGHMKSEVCANLIIDLISSNVKPLNGKFINLLGEEIPW